MSQRVKRIGVLLCVVLSMLAMAATSAYAAGKPTSVTVTNTHELGGYTALELLAKVNPNGANTETKITICEEEEASLCTSGAVHKLSGTTIRSYTEEFRIRPATNYSIKLEATNLYGTTYSTIGHKVAGRIMATGEKELSNVIFVSQGEASFTFTYLSLPFEVFCQESSTGHIGNTYGKEDIYKYSMYGCTTYINHKVSTECNVSNFTFTLSGPQLAVQNPFFIPLPVPEGCGTFGGDFWQVYAEPFRVVDNGSSSEYGVSRPVSLTATGYLYTKGNPAEITIESNWSLTGELAKTPFKIASVGPS